MFKKIILHSDLSSFMIIDNNSFVSCKEQSAVSEIRNRAVPKGTVGGRIGNT